MKTHISFVLLAFVLAASLGLPRGSSQAASPAEATAGEVMLPTAYKTTIGSDGGQPVGNLALLDQAGTDDNPAAYVSFLTPGTAYRGYRVFSLPSTVLRSTVTGLDVGVNFKGPAKDSQAWSWYLYNWSTQSWVWIGDNASASPWVWSLLSFSPANPVRFIRGTTGEIRLQLRSGNASANAKLDYEAISVGYNFTPTPPPTETATASPTASATATPGGIITPYPEAPLCPDTGTEHDPNRFHTLWDSTRGCHYDHEHGKSPFTPGIAALFPGFDLHALLGGVEIGHTNPSSPMENTMKHGGFKWQVGTTPQGCVGGFENARYCVAAYAVQYHNFGDYSMELEGRIHSTAALLKVCDPAHPSDCGYMYAVQFQDYGQRVSPYQGDLLPYPNNPAPSYPTPRGPYLTMDCVGLKAPGLLGACRTRLAQIRSMNLNTNSIWVSKGGRTAPSGSKIFKLLFRVRDTYQVVKWNEDGSIPSYPFTFLYPCGGATYNPVGCRYNNSTSTIHEVAGTIPASWDGSSFDQDPRPRRVTAEGFVTRFGRWNPACTEPSVEADCFPIKMVGMYVGFYGSELSRFKVDNATPANTPERDIYFCNGIRCGERSPGALPSGWIGGGN